MSASTKTTSSIVNVNATKTMGLSTSSLILIGSSAVSCLLVVGILTLEVSDVPCAPALGESRESGCTCYLDDSWSMPDCPAWNMIDPRPGYFPQCACDIVYVPVIKPYTDTIHADTCDLWHIEGTPDYDPDYFPTAIHLGRKHNKKVWAMTPYRWGALSPWDEVRRCIGVAASMGLHFEGLYINFEWKGCQSDGPECTGGLNSSACITPEDYPGFCDSLPGGVCTTPGGWQDLGVKKIRTSIGETARPPHEIHTCYEEWVAHVEGFWMCNDEGEPTENEGHPCRTCSNDQNPEIQYLFHWLTGARNPPDSPYWFDECSDYRPDYYIDIFN